MKMMLYGILAIVVAAIAQPALARDANLILEIQRGQWAIVCEDSSSWKLDGTERSAYDAATLLCTGPGATQRSAEVPTFRRGTLNPAAAELQDLQPTVRGAIGSAVSSAGAVAQMAGTGQMATTGQMVATAQTVATAQMAATSGGPVKCPKGKYPPKCYPCLGCEPCPGNPTEYCDTVWNQAGTQTGSIRTVITLNPRARRDGWYLVNGRVVAAAKAKAAQ